MAADERDEPRAGERVPYIIVYGTPGSPIIDLVRRYSMFSQTKSRIAINCKSSLFAVL